MFKLYFISRKQTLGGRKKPNKSGTKLLSRLSGNDEPVMDCGDIGFEMRCVLYNIGAAHSRLAASQDRSPLTTFSESTTEKMEAPPSTALKVACTHLQCAAWAFEVCL